MAWRGSADIKDRIFASLVYLLPLYYGFQFGSDLVQQFPIFSFLSILLIPMAFIVGAIPFGDFILFLVLYLAVVRNTRISHFIRYNTMQAILLDILVFLLGLVFPFVITALGDNIITQTLSNTIFLGTLIACLYCIIQSALGKYAEIPGISEAAYTQVRY
ncbi:conserved hypothetical protein [Gloeothece citriformis PCC 7424]|uniref:Tic20 family protein n=1 Tax=Gloeothece citriformis (strain PCC 7424) TaxID=65393 RepID=B7KD40_GLOC7|nr:Tic20 family protein [Gloeothece citriformis]ACK73161.1 conserved hypothetical protein [Gloeothece citriformis PCC 7424]